MTGKDEGDVPAKLPYRVLEGSTGAFRFRIAECENTAEALRTQRKTNEDILISKNYRNTFDARVKSFFAF
jgi:hypothetical protein